MKPSSDNPHFSAKLNSSIRQHNLDFLLRPIRKILLILIFVSTSCTPGSAPPNANGAAILGWGGNSSGQIGDGSTLQRLTPSLVALRNIQAIAAGGDYSLALTSDGRVLEWGGNQNTPTQVSGLNSIKQIAVGDRHRLALKRDGTVWAWGENNHGQLGDGTTMTRSLPVQLAGLSKIGSIAAGGDHSLALGLDFSVWSWGANNYGQIGNGNTIDQLAPIQLSGFKAIEVVASSNHSLALTTQLNKVMGWGSNKECQLGVDPRTIDDPIVCSDHLVPTLILEQLNPPFPSPNGHALAATNSMSLIVANNGWVFGLGGSGDPNPNLFRGMCIVDVTLGPAVIPITARIKEIVAGTDFALLLTDTGEVWSLGANPAGQGGLGTTTAEECPHAISSTMVRGVSQVAAGKEHSLALIKGALNFSPTTLDFGNQRVGTNSAWINIMITNTGLAPITFYGINAQGDYSFSENCPNSPRVLAAGSSCTLQVRFRPTTLGKRDGKIQLFDDGQASPQEIIISGNGT